MIHKHVPTIHLDGLVVKLLVISSEKPAGNKNVYNEKVVIMDMI